MWRYFVLLICITGNVHSNAQLKKRLHSLLQLQPANLPGFALVVEQDGKLLYNNQVGLANAETPEKINSGTNFRMASVTKQFTAMGILLLQQKHQLSVNDPIGKYLPGLRVGIGRKVLIRHLLTHSSGILDYEELLPATQTTQLLDADVLKLLQDKDTTYFTPGTQFRYSNSGFCLLALIIEKAAQQPYALFIKEKILQPLHMDESVVYESGISITKRAMGYAKDSSGAIVPSDQSITSATKGDGGLYTSVNNYIKWVHALQQNRWLKLPGLFKQMHQPTDAAANSFYSAGWFYTAGTPQVLFHSGSTCGFNNYVILVPAKKLSIIFFSNLADSRALFRQVLETIYRCGFTDYTGLFALQDLTR